VVVVDRFCGGWGPRFGRPWGFYAGPSFWFGFTVASLLTYDAWAARPIYIVSPVSQYNCGPLPAPVPNSPVPQQTQLELGVLNAMADPQQDPNSQDPTAGLYQAKGDNIDPANPGQKVSAEFAFNLLKQNQGVYFHPPNGAYERLNNMGDLDTYLYSQETAPPAGTQVLPQNAAPSAQAKTPAPAPAPAPQPAPPPAQKT